MVVSWFETGLRPWVSEEFGRLLGGSDVWLAMWLATTTPVPDGWSRSLQWCDVWDRISPMVCEYFFTAATVVNDRRSGEFVDPDLVSAYEAATVDGVQVRIAAILEAATTEST